MQKFLLANFFYQHLLADIIKFLVKMEFSWPLATRNVHPQIAWNNSQNRWYTLKMLFANYWPRQLPAYEKEICEISDFVTRFVPTFTC
jgi:hypothetical protein